MTFHQDIGFQPPPPQNPLAIVPQIQQMREIQGQNALGAAYQQAVDPVTGQIDQAKLANALTASKAPWMVGPGGIEAGRSMEAQGLGTQAQMTAQQQQTSILNGFLNGFDMSKPVPADQVDQKLQEAVRGGYATPTYYAQWQRMKQGMDPSELADVRPLIQAYKYVGLNAQQQAERTLGPTVYQRQQAMLHLSDASEPWKDEHGNTFYGTNADRARYYGLDPNSIIQGGYGQGPYTENPRGTTAVENPAARDQLASLPEVQRLPPAMQSKAVDAMVNADLGPQAGAQFARMLWQESHGNQVDPATGKIVTSTAGAQGIAQVKPGTFGDMQKKYGIQGDINDVDANLNAGAHYFREGLEQGNGDLRAAAAYYVGGPDGLKAYLGGQAGRDVTDYIQKTGAAGGGGGGGGASGGYMPPGRGPTRLSQTTGPLALDSGQMFAQARHQYYTQPQRVSNLTQALQTLRSTELETGPLAQDMRNLRGVAEAFGITLSPDAAGYQDSFDELNKKLSQYYLSQPGADRSDYSELQAKMSQPGLQMHRQALDDLLARTIGLEMFNTSAYRDFTKRHGVNASADAGQFADEAGTYMDKYDPVGWGYKFMNGAERKAYYNSLPDDDAKARYKTSMEEAAKQNHWKLPWEK